jgi:ferredoxin-type protein NapH
VSAVLDGSPRVPAVAGAAAVRARGWWPAHRFLLLRRASQLSLLALFLLGPWAGIWIVKGNLSASLTLGVLPLTDPFVLAQALAARHVPELSALLGAAIVLAFYGLLAGRGFCSWVCPVNVVTDAAAWLRRRLKLGAGRAPSRSLRWWLLGAVLVASAITGQMAWEAVNPVSMTQRALIFGGSVAWGVLAAVFAFDLLVATHGWCGHVCPVGASYALIGSRPLLRVAATRSARCDDCGDCFAVCPEPQVIVLPLKGRGGHGPVITDRSCTACGRCIDVCAPDVFRFTHRFDSRRDPA